MPFGEVSERRTTVRCPSNVGRASVRLSEEILGRMGPVNMSVSLIGEGPSLSTKGVAQKGDSR